MKKQTSLPCSKVKTAERLVRRGDIFYADLSGISKSRGSEQTGRRPVLVIQNDSGNRYAPTTIVAIMTSKQKRKLPTHVTLDGPAGLNRASTVCLEQIRTIDKSRLENYKGNIGADAMRTVDKAIAASLGI